MGWKSRRGAEAAEKKMLGVWRDCWGGVALRRGVGGGTRQRRTGILGGGARRQPRGEGREGAVLQVGLGAVRPLRALFREGRGRVADARRAHRSESLLRRASAALQAEGRLHRRVDCACEGRGHEVRRPHDAASRGLLAGRRVHPRIHVEGARGGPWRRGLLLGRRLERSRLSRRSRRSGRVEAVRRQGARPAAPPHDRLRRNPVPVLRRLSDADGLGRLRDQRGAPPSAAGALHGTVDNMARVEDWGRYELAPPK